MKKIVTILTLASLFAAVSASAVRAETASIKGEDVVVGNGVVEQNCTLDVAGTGTLKLKNPSTLDTKTPGKLKVTCNTTTNKLDIAVNVAGSTLNGGSATTNFNGGTNEYSTAAGTNITPGTTVNAAVANIEATISAPAGQLLVPGTNYAVFVTPTLTP